MKRIVIVGATSGIGLEVAKRCIRKGWRVGIAGRRTEPLEALRSPAPEQVETARIDITEPDAPQQLAELVDRLGGMDIYLHVAGIGSQNPELHPDIELDTLRTNGEGFVRMVTAAFRLFRDRNDGSLRDDGSLCRGDGAPANRNGGTPERDGRIAGTQAHGAAPYRGGQIAVISSIAGTRGLGAAPAYSATKRMQNTYIDALAQLARMERLPIRFTDIRPGFVDTPLLRDGRYPLLMPVDYAAKRIVRAIERRKRRAVIDWRYALLVLLWRALPAWLWERLPVR